MNHFTWKLCRVLANKSRLKILQLLLNEPELCVCDIAQGQGLTRPSASKHIQLLSEYNFIETTPSSKWLLCRVYESSKNDPLDDVRKIIFKKLRGDETQIDSIYQSATAFTHERRIRIIQLLRSRNMPLENLISASEISGIALTRHIKKLANRGLVAEDDGIYRFTSPADPFLKSLLHLF